MGQSCLVDGICEEGQVKYPVGVIIGDIHQQGMRALMLEQHHLRSDRREWADLLRFKSVYHITDFRKGGVLVADSFRDFCLGRFIHEGIRRQSTPCIGCQIQDRCLQDQKSR